MTHFLSTIINNYLAQNLSQILNLAELGAKMPFFRKIKKFIKSERSNEFFPSLIPNVFER